VHEQAQRVDAPAARPADPAAVSPLLRRTAIIGAALAVAASAALAAGVLPVGSRAGRYVYPYARTFALDVLWPFAAVAVIVLAGLWLSARWHDRRPVAVVAGWMAAAVPVQLLLRLNDDASIGDIVTSTRANGFWDAALAYTPGEFLTTHTDIVDQLDSHVRTNMAGKTAFYQLLAAVTDSPTGAGVLIVLVSSLSALLLYLIARDLLDARTALYTLVLAILVPGRLYFLPILNTVAPVAILAALWLLVRYLRRPRWAWAAGMGTVLYLTVFFEPLPLALGLVFAGLLAWALATRRISGPHLVRLCVVTLAAFFACHLLISRWPGTTWWPTSRTCSATRSRSTATGTARTTCGCGATCGTSPSARAWPPPCWSSGACSPRCAGARSVRARCWPCPRPRCWSRST
jgi:hypothetical protein